MRIAQTGNEEEVLSAYTSQGGRNRIEASLLGKSTDNIRREFGGYTTLLKYWRDAASHGASSGISDNEAYTSLALLLRFAQFTNDRWNQIVGTQRRAEAASEPEQFRSSQ
jgi:transposase-like protein